MRRTLTWIVLGIVALAACAWLAAPMLAGWAARLAAQRAGLTAVAIAIDRVGFTRLHANYISFRADTDRGPVTVTLRGATLGYDLAARTLGAVHAEAGSLDWQPPEVPAPAPSAAIPAPLLPLISARVDAFELRLNLKPGAIALAGPLVLDLDPTAGAHAVLTAPDSTLDIAFPADGQRIELNLAVPGEKPLATVEVNDPLGLNTRVALKADAGALLAWAGAGNHLPAPWRDTIAAASLQSGEISAAAQYLVATDAWRIEHLTAAWQELRASKFRTSGNLELSAQPDQQTWNVQALAPGRFDIESMDGTDPLAATVEIAEGLAVTVGADGAWQGQGDARITARGRGLADARVTLDAWKFTPSVASLHARELSMQQPALRAAELRLEAGPGEGGWSGLDSGGQLVLAGVHPDIGAITPELIVNAAWRLSGADRLEADVATRLDGQSAGNATVGWRLAAAEGEVKANWSVEVGSLIAWARALWPPLEAAGAEHGVFAGTADLAWRAGALHGTAKARLSELSARYEEARVDKADVEITVSDLAAPAYSFSARIPTATAATGLPVTDIRLAGTAKGRTIRVSNGGLKVWGGAVRLRPGTIDTGGDSRLVLEVDKLDLEQALRFIDVSGLGGSGLLTGTVPVVFRAGSIELEKAELASTAPGTLRYVSAAPAAAGNIALQALQDFRYAALSAGLAYGRDGDYTISARLRGSNPGLYNGYPIAFNINLTGQLPGLLRGALLTGDFDREVMKQVRLDAGRPAAVPAAPAPDQGPPAPGR